MKFAPRIILLAVLLHTTLACENYIGGDINTDPNKPSTVPIFTQLPAIQLAVTDNYGGDFSRFNALLIQQIEGVARSWNPFTQYTSLTPERFAAAWRNIYEKSLNEIKLAKTLAEENGYTHYGAVLKIIEAFTLMSATDVWDDIPYSDALNGLDAPSPTYDTQARIYAIIHTLLDEALAAFEAPAGRLTPANEDIFYGGDMEQWKKAAYAIKARGLLHYKAYEAAAAAAQQSFVTPSDNLAYQYPDVNTASPWYRFNRDRTGDFEFHPSMRALLEGLNDVHRLAKMDQAFTPHHSYLIPDFLQELITYREMQFIIAEVDVRQHTGGTVSGYAAYLAGIEASFARLAVDGYEAYIAQAAVNPGVGNLSLEHVMTQKYIALFLQAEAYSDWRRTAIPALTPLSGASIPVRWDYSSDEYLFNSNAPAAGSINIFTDRVDWNK